MKTVVSSDSLYGFQSTPVANFCIYLFIYFYRIWLKFVLSIQNSLRVFCNMYYFYKKIISHLKKIYLHQCLLVLSSAKVIFCLVLISPRSYLVLHKNECNKSHSIKLNIFPRNFLFFVNFFLVFSVNALVFTAYI